MDAAGDGVGFQADEGDSRGGVQESKPQREGPGPRRGADIYFGWQERVLKRAMQVHYAAMSIRERMATAVVTGMM